PPRPRSLVFAAMRATASFGSLQPVGRLETGDKVCLPRRGRLENRRLALPDLEPVLAKGIEDVGLVRYNQCIRPGGGRGRYQLPEGLGATIVLDGRRDQAALREVQRRRDVGGGNQPSCFDCAVELAGVGSSDRNLQSLERLADLPGNVPAACAQQALLRDVVV